MAAIYKISGYLIDANGQYENYGESVKDAVEMLLEDNADFITQHICVEKADIGEWDDDLPINKINCPKEECEKYFK